MISVLSKYICDPSVAFDVSHRIQSIKMRTLTPWEIWKFGGDTKVVSFLQIIGGICQEILCTYKLLSKECRSSRSKYSVDCCQPRQILYQLQEIVWYPTQVPSYHAEKALVVHAHA